MENLDNIYKYFEEPITMLVVNNNSTKVLDEFFKLVYKKINTRKIEIRSRKGLFNKLLTICGKVIKLNYELSSIQFGSSKSTINKDFKEIRVALEENNSRLLCRTDVRLNSQLDVKRIYHSNINNHFDLIVLIEKDKMILIKCHTKSFMFYNDNGTEYDISRLVRSTKLKKISNIFK